jgi:hypothetical protein
LKYTEQNVDAFVKAIRMGMKIKNSCELIGISQETYFTWMKEHPEFSDSIKRARGERTQEALAIIRKAAIKSWQAAAWYLERTFPDQYGLKTQISGYLDGADDETLKKQRAQRLTRRLNEIIEEQVKASGNGAKPAAVDVKLNGTRPGNETEETSQHSNGSGNDAEIEL